VREVEGWGLSGSWAFEVGILKVEKSGENESWKQGLSWLYYQTGYTIGFFSLIG